MKQEKRKNSFFFKRSLAWGLDTGLSSLMNVIQWNLQNEVHSSILLDTYLSECETLTREEYYAVPPMQALKLVNNRIFWDSPLKDCYVENNRACAEWYSVHPHRPTIILLHALMSAYGGGYRRLAKWFNQRGWNAVFPHLPCHYSRAPAGYLNGALTMTANLVRNALLIQQGIIEIRQLMGLLRTWGCEKFALLGTSYGGWIGSLVSFLESDFDFMSLLQPIINIKHVLEESPIAHSIRRILAKNSTSPAIIQKHEHLSSPLHGKPLCNKERIILATGVYDRISPLSELEKLAHRWECPAPLEVAQGHVGYTLLRTVKKRITFWL